MAHELSQWLLAEADRANAYAKTVRNWPDAIPYYTACARALREAAARLESAVDPQAIYSSLERMADASQGATARSHDESVDNAGFCDALHLIIPRLRRGNLAPVDWAAIAGRS